jgi:hypothetical protein
LGVGAQHPGTGLLEPVQDGRVRVPVRVVGADRHDRHPRIDRVQELRQLVRRAVVRHLEHVRLQPLRTDLSQQRLLQLHLRVTGEQHSDSAQHRKQHDGVVVRVGSGADQLVAGAEHGERELPDQIAGAGLGRPHRGAPRGRGGGDELVTVLRLGQAGGEHRSDPAAAEHTFDPGHVVGVEVADHQQRDRPDPQVTQAAVGGGRVRPGIHHHRGPAGHRQHQQVALPDRARHHHRVRRWPAAGHCPHRQRADHHRGGGDGGNHPHPAVPERQEPGDREPRQQQPARDPVRPRQLGRGQPGTVPGHQHQPPGGPAAQPGEQLRHRAERGGDRREHAEHRGRSHRRRRHQVGGHRDQADRTGASGDHRRHRDLGGGRNRERVRDHRRHTPAAQRRAPAGGEQQQPTGGEHRHREPGIAGELRVDHHQPGDGGAERRHGRGGPARGERHQRHRTHRCGPDHRRIWPAQDDVADQPGAGHGRGEPRRCPGHPREQHDEPDHDRDVRSTDSGQMRHTGGPEVVVDDRVQAIDVSDREPRHQAAGLGRQRRGGGS